MSLYNDQLAAGIRLEMIVCILPTTGITLYSEIKRVTDTIIGVPSQCLQVKHTFQPKKQFCANVCLKLNVKLGGINSLIVPNSAVPNDPGMPWMADSPSMIFGADVSHPSYGDHRTSGTTCALVGSMDRLASVYKATVRLQPARREIIMELSSMVNELLRGFYLENDGIPPQRILFYRSGVSDTQFHKVAAAEIKAIR